ncbi:lysophospholipid acyltransferase family protein [Galbibacter pacificus]|uniref:Lysophospholipid acyltransferase family protein n=1 Tax=Galbibacter pacificus TaxID=2996052 RepID=A0ABT6FQA5_9FLAO|nr:lysophospholipid acyltransferase family protein [Galbibacter pacificus]MDG3582075.1 lysophospholipid acyltransferase family protein [Galbibacter pacificus]MDG3585449.1 lysophospholipid acyltransferase family protein [Galbibacter pacificus]
MQLLIYLLTYPILWCISILPFPIFYKVSDGVFMLLYYVIGYRKKLVLKNLELCFPEKSEAELLVIRKKFYQHMCDLFLEMIKSLTMSRKEMDKRAVFHNLELLDKYAEENKSVALLCGHYANYEWVLSLGNHIKHNGYGIYSPLTNKYFDRLIKKTRKRNGGELVSRYNTAKFILKHQRENHLSLYGFVNDQSPQVQHTKYWREFFGVKVPVFTAAETLAKKFDMAVVFFCVKKVKRGYYETTIVNITDSSKDFPDYEITDIYWEYLEKEISNQPEYYLWTHNRFKHRDKAPD